MRALYETGNLLEMGDISKKTTKLPVNVWFSVRWQLNTINYLNVL